MGASPPPANAAEAVVSPLGDSSEGFPPFRQEALYALVGFALALVLGYALGYRMYIPYWYFQFLDVRLLEDRLWESMLYLHSQPPVLNLLLAGALHLKNAFAWNILILVFVFHVLLGCVAIPASVYTCRVLIPDTFRRRILIALLVFHPVFYASLYNFFYTFQEIVILALLPVAACVYLKSRRLLPLTGLCLVLLWLCYTRSMFHLTWALGLTLFLMFTNREEGDVGLSRPSSGEVLLLLLFAALLIAWPLKNKIIFDSFTSSTWQGYSLAKGLLPDVPADTDIERPPPPPEFDIPALAWDEKADPAESGVPARNWNHYALIGDFRDRQRRAFEVLRDDPSKLFKRMGYHYWCFSRFTGRHPYTASFGTMANVTPRWAEPWMRLYEALLVQEFRSPYYLRNPWFREKPTRFWHVSGFFFTFPLILGFTARKIFRRWRTHPLEARIASVLFLTVLWVFTMIILVDGDEANRIRTSTEPYTIMLALWLIPPTFIEKLRTRGRPEPVSEASA